MYEYKCQRCGAVRTAKYKKDVHRYCSRSCATKARYETPIEEDPPKVIEDYNQSIEWKRGPSRLWVCPYAENVNCKNRRCLECGWNPEVAKERSRQILMAMGGMV